MCGISCIGLNQSTVGAYARTVAGESAVHELCELVGRVSALARMGDVQTRVASCQGAVHCAPKKAAWVMRIMFEESVRRGHLCAFKRHDVHYA